MTLNKFDKQIRDTLKGREIKPSESAWEKVSEGLDLTEKPKGVRNYRYGIAAGFIGLLFISVLYFRQGPEPSPPAVVVGKPAEAQKVTEGKREGIEIPDEKEVKSITSYINSPRAAEEKRKAVSVPPRESPTEVAASEITASPVSVRVERSPDVVIETKLTEILATVQLMEQRQQTVSDREVDSLLWQAQAELLTDHSEAGLSVNATALLLEVEDELDESFRDQLFDKLKTGFQKVRTAVADRNN